MDHGPCWLEIGTMLEHVVGFLLGQHGTMLEPWWVYIHPALRGVADHTAGLFRSVRGAKGGFPPWGLPKLRIFTSPPVGAPQAREFSLFPPVGAPQAREFSLSPRLPKLGNFHFSPRRGSPS